MHFYMLSLLYNSPPVLYNHMEIRLKSLLYRTLEDVK